jgi:2-oxoisovalerate dehydrogenase E1 component
MARVESFETRSRNQRRLKLAPKPQRKAPTKTIEKDGANGLHAVSGKISNQQLVRAYTEMLRARVADEKTIVLYKQNKCHFQIGCAGHEAIGVAAGHAFRANLDWSFPYYRDMAYCAALGMTSREFMLNAMNKADDPNSHGRQMPMHYGHKNLRIVNQSSPTGTQFLQAVGVALGAQRTGQKEVVYVSSGEGTCAQGDFHEALNWAAREKLPVIFLIQNNEYAISVHVSEQLAGQSVVKLAGNYENMESHEVDGTDYAASFKVIKHAHNRALRGEGPTLIEARVPRLQSHSISDNHLKYRDAKDIEAEQKRCPIARLRAELLKTKVLKLQEIEAIEQQMKQEVNEAAEWAEAQPDCSPDDAHKHVLINNEPWAGIEETQAKGEEIYIVDALNHALDEELTRNPNMYVFGQDVAHGKGGVFTVTAGLTAKHGVERVFNAPLAESSIAGVAIGMATRGLKPVAEIQFGDYVWTAMMQIRNELAMMLYRSGGDFSCPAVIRIPVGGYIHGAAYHSQNIEATFAHFPGLHVVYPSNATDAKGLLKAAIRAQDPVLFLEHKGLYRQVYAKGAEGDKDFLVPLGKAKIVHPGEHLTIVTWGAIVNKSLLAAKELEKQGISVEVIDLRTITPLDTATIFESVKKTGRVLVAHEDVQFMGFGAEIAAQIADSCFTHLDAPVKRVGMKPVAAVAHSQFIENVILPQNEDVLAAAHAVLNF